MNLAGSVLLAFFAFVDLIVLMNLRRGRRLTANNSRMNRVLASAVRRDLAVAVVRPRRTLLRRAS